MCTSIQRQFPLTDQEISDAHRATCTPEMLDLYALFTEAPDSTGWMVNGLQPVTDGAKCGCGRFATYVVLGPDYPYCTECLSGGRMVSAPIPDVDLLPALTASVAARLVAESADAALSLRCSVRWLVSE